MGINVVKKQKNVHEYVKDGLSKLVKELENVVASLELEDPFELLFNAHYIDYLAYLTGFWQKTGGRA